MDLNTNLSDQLFPTLIFMEVTIRKKSSSISNDYAYIDQGHVVLTKMLPIFFSNTIKYKIIILYFFKLDLILKISG